MVDFGKMALVHGSLAFELHIAAMTLFDNGGSTLSKTQAVQAMLIIAFLLLLVSFLLLLLMHYADTLKGNKIALICLMVFFFLSGTPQYCKVFNISVSW